jgi:rod shape-determining protein MreD
VARVLAYVTMLAGALVIQLSVLDPLPLPGGTAPDLVLLVVVAIGLTSGALPGTVTGFIAGLALDLAPPATHAVGEYALVFCLVGYFCGRAAGEIDRSAFLPLAAMALGVITGSVLYTGVGMTFGEADVTWAAAQRVLPFVIAYDLVLSPFVLYGVMRLTRWAGKAAEDPVAVLARTSMRSRTATGRPAAPKQPRIGSAASRAPSLIGTGAASAMAAVAGRSSGVWGSGQSERSGRTGPGGRPAPPPRLRFGSSKLPGTTPVRAPGVFSGGSLIGTTTVRLRLGNGKAARLRALTARVFGFGRPHQPAMPRFSPGKTGAGLRGPAAAGSRRGLVGGRAGLGRGPGIRFGGGSSLGEGPRLGGRPTAGRRPRFGRGPRFRPGSSLGHGPLGGAGLGRGRAVGGAYGRGSTFRPAGLGRAMGMHRIAGWLPSWRPRRRRPEVWRTTGGRTGGLR